MIRKVVVSQFVSNAQILRLEFKDLTVTQFSN